MTVLIVTGVLLASVAGTLALTLFGRWLRRLGDTRIGLAELDANRLDAHAVAATEAELMPPGFDLGRTRPRRLTLAARLAAYRNEASA